MAHLIDPTPRPPRYELDFTAASQTSDGVRAVPIAGTPVSIEGRYRIGDNRIEQSFGLSLPPVSADLVDIAMSVYAADRVSPRRVPARPDPYRLQWRRHLALRVPVREPERWSQPHLSDSLCALLESMTDDRWSVDFVRRHVAPRYEQGYLFPTRPPRPVEVAPFSAGLDSLAGVAARLVSEPDLHVVTFAGGTNGRVVHRQRELIGALSRRFSPRVHPVEVPFGLIRDGQPYPDGEPTQRSRGFVFFVLAAVVAEQACADTVTIHENGVGALSLAYNRTQLGARTTRATHPLALLRLGRLLTEAFGHPFRIHNPSLYETKAAMCARLADAGLAGLAARSVSCDTFSSCRVPTTPQCGLCTSCLLRRQALHAAGLAPIDAESGYRRDVTNPRDPLNERQLYDLHAMLDQVADLRACTEAPSPWNALTGLAPTLEQVRLALADAEGRTIEEVADDLVALYRAYVREWDAFPYVSAPRKRAS